jgi:hypothetical protein
VPLRMVRRLHVHTPRQASAEVSSCPRLVLLFTRSNTTHPSERRWRPQRDGSFPRPNEVGVDPTGKIRTLNGKCDIERWAVDVTPFYIRYSSRFASVPDVVAIDRDIFLRLAQPDFDPFTLQLGNRAALVCRHAVDAA